MNNSNSFNVCSRCGSANSLSAKYCYQCGSQLTVPDEPVVCPKCHSINSSMANFCRTCGTTLKTSTRTKICPRCKRQIPLEQTQCSCGYAFPAIDQEKGNKSGKQRGGRGMALLSLLFTALFAIILTIPFDFMHQFVNQSNLYALGITLDGNAVGLSIVDIIYLLAEVFNSFSMETLTELTPLLGVLSMISVTVVVMAVHALCALIRIFHGKRGKGVNVFYLIMTIAMGSSAVLLVLANSGAAAHLPDAMQSYLLTYVMPGDFVVGWGIFVIPAYYLFFFIFSFFARRKKQTKR